MTTQTEILESYIENATDSDQISNLLRELQAEFDTLTQRHAVLTSLISQVKNKLPKIKDVNMDKANEATFYCIAPWDNRVEFYKTVREQPGIVLVFQTYNMEQAMEFAHAQNLPERDWATTNHTLHY